MTITVFGLGFVGLTTALGLSSKGHKVYGIDIDQTRCAKIADGMLPFLEPGLDQVLGEELGIHFFLSDSPKDAVSESDCVFFCVGTPYGENGQADLTYLFSAMDSALSGISKKNHCVFVVKSTIPPATLQKKVIPYLVSSTTFYGDSLSIANNPEFLREGHCWEDFMQPDRIVIGVTNQESENILRAVYQGFDCPIVSVSPNTAEFIKYLSNTLLATMISYSNEMSLIADAIGGIDVAKAFQILHMDKRWGGCNMTSYVYPGCGYGGYCLPKDTNALLAQSKANGFNPPILSHVIRTNDEMPQHMAERIMSKTTKEEQIAILGLSFKPGSDDVRQSPAAPILRHLQQYGYDKLVAYDPVANKLFAKAYPDIHITYYDSLSEVLTGSNSAVILTAWDEFKQLNSMDNISVIDCRYMLTL
nr:UDP-glucose/GDP-mannose dehydrogenase family protein [uncultured Butyricicoccus sp.]